MTTLADDVLPLIRTRADLHSVRASNAHGTRMEEAVGILEEAADTVDQVVALEVFTVTQKAIASALKVIMRADDSSGIIGDAIRRLLVIHADVAAPALVSPSKLVDWMITFQFHNDCDFFTIDPIAYAYALAEPGMRRYRKRLDEIRDTLGPVPDGYHDPDRHTRYTLEWNDRRIAVLYRDVDQIIRTHARDQKVAAWPHDTARALAEIEEYDLAIEWAHRAATEYDGHQAEAAAETWCELLATHRPDHLLDARTEVFRRWPSSDTAARLYAVAGDGWTSLRDEVTDTLSGSPSDAVLFSLNTIGDAELAWAQAHTLSLDDYWVWLDLIARYEKIDPEAVLGPLAMLVDVELRDAKVSRYKRAARHLTRMRKLAAGTERAVEVDAMIRGLRHENRHRRRLLAEFDRVGLP